MIDRRHLVAGLVCASTLLAKQAAFASPVAASDKIDWPEFVMRMKALSNRFVRGETDQSAMERQGLGLITRLDINAPSFEQAVSNSYESGNLFWLWQRLVKSGRLDGGILNIDQTQMIPLHDHPGATGMVRVISGETEVWQFERLGEDIHKPGKAELRLVARQILRPGDTATITPDNGNIHALRSVSNECRMLDFFIPPFDRAQLLYYEPTDENWFGKEHVSCRAIPRVEFTRS